MILMNKLKFLILFIIFGMYACQQIEIIDKVVFNYEQLPNLNINAEEKIITNLYEPKLVEPYVDHSMSNPPVNFLDEWFNNNINTFGTQNKLEINVIDASLKKSEIPNTSEKKYKEKTIFLFEINFLVEFVLYDDSNYILASSIVEAKSSTTSGKYISLHESERIIDTLIFNCIEDFTIKANDLINIHMKNYIL